MMMLISRKLRRKARGYHEKFLTTACFKLSAHIFLFWQQMVPVDFAKKMKKWCEEGFKELGDTGGMGIGRTTHSVLRHPNFLKDPHEVH